MARRLTREQIISNVNYDVEDGFGSAQATLKRAKQDDPTITLDDVKNFLKKQPNKQIKRYRGSNSYTAPFPRYEYQMDIMDMVPLTRGESEKVSEKPAPLTKEEQKTKTTETNIPVENGQPRYALVVIDIFSKFANVVPMKNKNGASVLSALKDTFKKMGFPMSIYSDDDGAFKSVVKEFLEGENITQIITLTHANVAERFIRTLKNMIHDRVRFNKADWTNMLTPVLNKYNNTKHSSTNMTPKQAHKDDNTVNVRVNLTMKENNKRKYPNISEGDDVKIFDKKRGNYTDRKEYVSKWSKNSYKVDKIKYDAMGNKTFMLQGLSKPYLRHEILLV